MEKDFGVRKTVVYVHFCFILGHCCCIFESALIIANYHISIQIIYKIIGDIRNKVGEVKYVGFMFCEETTK